MNGPMKPCRLFVGKLLHIIRDNDTSNSSVSLSNTKSAIYKMADLGRLSTHVYIFMRHIFEQREKIYFLLVIAADTSSSLLPYYCYNGLMVHFCIIQSIQE